MDQIWNSLSRLRDKLLYDERIDVLYKTYVPTNPDVNADTSSFLQEHATGDNLPAQTDNQPADHSREYILKTIEGHIKHILEALSKNETPSYVYRNARQWDDISLSTTHGLQLKEDAPLTAVKLDSIQSVKKFAMITKVLSMIYKLIQTDSYSTKRDMYYQDPGVFGSQAAIDSAVDQISCMLQIPRWELHVLATSKGLVAGDLVIRDQDGNYIDCKQTDTGVVIPNHVCGIKDLQTSARFILVIEKDATFQKLLDDGFCQKMAPCIIVTAKGFPDVNTRLFLRKIWDNFHIPSLALVDADPHGIEIMSVYKFGSRSMSYEGQNLSLPTLRWLGVLPSDIQRYRIDANMKMPMTKSDIDKANSLLKREYFVIQHQWKDEVTILLNSGMKAEIQSLSDISPNFLTDVFIPQKLQSSAWL